MRYIECPEFYDGKDKSLFISGGIGNCENWQNTLINLLKDEDILIINPRRESYDTDHVYIEEEQIGWEYENLQKASAYSFWFPKESLCPITLFELGKEIISNKPLFIGMDKEYGRRKNLEVQMRFHRPEVKIVYSLEDLVNQIKSWAKEGKEK
jgi:hypothetical protein